MGSEMCIRDSYSPAYRALLAWLRSHRIAKRLTMRKVGLRMGIPHSWVGKVEIGERRLDVAEYVELCRAIEADPARGIAIVEAALGSYVAPASSRRKATEEAVGSGRVGFRHRNSI